MNTHGIIGQMARIRERSNLIIERELRNREIEGIVPAHGPVLYFLFQQSQPVPIKAIVEKVGRVKSTVTSMLKTLQRYDYIRKIPCESDNRVTYIELTQKGSRLRGHFEDISKHLIETVYGDMPGGEREALVLRLNQIEQNLNG